MFYYVLVTRCPDKVTKRRFDALAINRESGISASGRNSSAFASDPPFPTITRLLQQPILVETIRSFSEMEGRLEG
jgi:hypothetical protein